jgi:hypothetical protein
MKTDELIKVIEAAGGGGNALAYADGLLEKINRLEANARYEALLSQLRTAREALRRQSRRGWMR